MYLSTLRGYVEAIGGKLELIVKLPRRPALHLRHLGDASSDPVPKTAKPDLDASVAARARQKVAK
jgi:hypothetical protein